MTLLVEKYFILFLLYSFAGWGIETILHSIEEKRFVYRGFFKGPYCPIYGCGALSSVFCLSRIENPLLIFVLGLMLCTALEYFTSCLMERIFHDRWWDYSNYRFNYQGRICLLCSIGFGMLIVLLIECVQPVAADTLDKIPLNMLHTFFISLLIVYVIDNIYSFASYGERIKKLIKIPQFSALPVIENIWRHGRKTTEQVNDKTA